MSRRARGGALAATLLLAAAVLTACGSTPARDGRTLDGIVRHPPLEVGTITTTEDLPDGATRPFTFRAAPGSLLAVYFGYTSCPDICPTTLSDLGRALDGLPSADRDRVSVAFATVDPERDSGTVIRSYLDHFVDGGHALRDPDPATRVATQDAFRVVAKRVEEGASYAFEHTAVTYVVDDAGRIVVEWPFGTTPARMRHDLRILLGGSG